MTFQQPHQLGLAIPLRSIASRLCGALPLHAPARLAGFFRMATLAVFRANI
jgi:hypothetical protein